MRIRDLYSDLLESITNGGTKPTAIKDGLPPAFQHSMPGTHSFPDLDNYYGFYRFVIALAGDPDVAAPLMSGMRDIPIAVAYTPQENEMIHRVSKKFGIKPAEIAYEGSRELPDTYTVSPVMKFHMSESESRRMRGLIMLSEAMLP